MLRDGNQPLPFRQRTRPNATSVRTDEPSKQTSIGCTDDLDLIRDQIIVDHWQLVDHAVSALGRAIHIGALASKAKSMLPHGQFTSWVDSELTGQCSITLRTVQRYMQLSKQSGQLFEIIRRRLEEKQAAPVKIQDVERTVYELQIDDALEILRKKNSTGLRNTKRSETEEIENEAIRMLEQLATRFFRGVPDWFDRPAPDQVKATSAVCADTLIVTADPRSAEELVTNCIQRAESDQAFVALLYLSGTCADRHGWILDTFPRVHFRQPGAPIDRNRYLFGLIPTRLQACLPRKCFNSTVRFSFLSQTNRPLSVLYRNLLERRCFHEHYRCPQLN